MKDYTNFIKESNNNQLSLDVDVLNNIHCVKFLNKCQNLSTFINLNKKDIDYFYVRGKINGVFKVLKWSNGKLYKTGNQHTQTNLKLSDFSSYDIDKIYMYNNTLWKKFNDEINTIGMIEKVPYEWDFNTKTLIFDSGNEYEYDPLHKRIIEKL